jgi:hypothetical protein
MGDLFGHYTMTISRGAGWHAEGRLTASAPPLDGHNFAFVVNQVAEVHAIARTARGGKPRVTKSRLILAR